MTTSTSRFGAPPPFQHFTTDSHRALVIALREAVAPLLGINLFHHFTDHTVLHSDSVCNHVDSLIAPLQQTDDLLSNDELLVLYCACYLHDAGMEYERADQTKVVKDLLPLTKSWSDLSRDERLDLIRRHHHEISAELVRDSTQSTNSPLGITLTDQYRPSEIACLCEAHCVTPTTTRYQVLMGDVPNIDMPFLSGVLRLADILDETSNRALHPRAQALDLSLESQMHWWRHYYTRDVTFSAQNRSITVHYEFPPSQAAEFGDIIPKLQFPWIEQEFRYHLAAFNRRRLNWTLIYKQSVSPYSTLKVMPESVVLEMLKDIRRRTVIAHESARQAALRTFKEARPYIERQLEAARSKKETLPSEQYFDSLLEISRSLRDIGSRRSAWAVINFEFAGLREQLSVPRRIAVGTELLEMLIADEQCDMANSWITQTLDDCSQLPPNSPDKQKFLSVAARALLLECSYDKSQAAFADAIAACTVDSDTAQLRAELSEMHLLQGELTKALDTVCKS